MQFPIGAGPIFRGFAVSFREGKIGSIIFTIKENYIQWCCKTTDFFLGIQLYSQIMIGRFNHLRTTWICFFFDFYGFYHGKLPWKRPTIWIHLVEYVWNFDSKHFKQKQIQEDVWFKIFQLRGFFPIIFPNLAKFFSVIPDYSWQKSQCFNHPEFDVDLFLFTSFPWSMWMKTTWMLQKFIHPSIGGSNRWFFGPSLPVVPPEVRCLDGMFLGSK